MRCPPRPQPPAGEGGEEPKELPDHVIMAMLTRESLLTRAKLHGLFYDQIMDERKLRSLKTQLRQVAPPPPPPPRVLVCARLDVVLPQPQPALFRWQAIPSLCVDELHTKRGWALLYRSNISRASNRKIYRPTSILLRARREDSLGPPEEKRGHPIRV